MQDHQVFGDGVAVVTGAGAGIGSGIARRLGELGMHVVVTDISVSRAEKVTEEIRVKGGSAQAQVVDVSKFAELDQLANEVFEQHGEVRLLVNNAGIETLGLTWEIPAERWEATLNINIHGVVHGARAFLPNILKSGKEAWIANLASIGAFAAMPTQAGYTMSKHAVESFSECLHLELELVGAPIHVCSVLPGMLKTSIFEEEGGAGEPDGARRHRAKMRELMAKHGMDLDEGCRRIVEQIAEGNFWVSTQPEMTAQLIEARVEFLRSQLPPKLGEQARQLICD